jgi:hypothetical protein
VEEGRWELGESVAGGHALHGSRASCWLVGLDRFEGFDWFVCFNWLIGLNWLVGLNGLGTLYCLVTLHWNPSLSWLVCFNRCVVIYRFEILDRRLSILYGW